MRLSSPRWIVVATAFFAIGCSNKKVPGADEAAPAPAPAGVPAQTTAPAPGEAEAAKQALAKIESAVAEIREPAELVASNDLKFVDKLLATLKKYLAQGNYQAVLAEAPNLTALVDQLKRTVTARAVEREAILGMVDAKYTEEWNRLSPDVIKMLDDIQSRINFLSRNPLPENVSQEDFDAAKSKLESMKTRWDKARLEFASGSKRDAVEKAQMLIDVGEWVLKKKLGTGA